MGVDLERVNAGTSDSGGDYERAPDPTPSIIDGDVPSDDKPSGARTSTNTAYRVTNILSAIIFVAAGSGGLVMIPQIQLLETAVCRELLHSADATGQPNQDPAACKGTEVQSTVAYIIAVGTALDSVISFLGAIPWSTVADRIGRKPVFVLALAGIATDNILWLVMIWLQLHFQIPSWSVWIGSAGLAIGGGNAMLTSVLLSTITDAAPEEIRAVLFMRVHAAALCASLLAPSLASALMGSFGPWIPMLLGVSLPGLSAGAACFIPETKRFVEHDRSCFRMHHGLPTSRDSRGPRPHSTLRRVFTQTVKSFRAFLPSVGRPSWVCLMATALLSQSLIPATMQLLVQYISTRYSVEIYTTGYVQTIYGVAQLVQLFIGLPLLARLVRARVASDAQRDLYLARFSFLVIIPGILLMASATNVTFFVLGLLVLALGAGCGSYQRSLLSVFVDPEYYSRLFMLVAMIDMVGSLYSGPMLAALLTSGMELGRGFLGLPYYALAVLMAICLGLMFFVRLPQ